MAEVLNSIWRTWTASVPAGVLATALAALLVAWVASGVAVHIHARRRMASAYGWVIATLVPSIAIASIGLTRVSAFHIWAVGGLVATPLLAVGSRALIERGSAVCTQGHQLGASWIYCGDCPPPPKDAQRGPKGAGTIIALRDAVGGPALAPSPGPVFARTGAGATITGGFVAGGVGMASVSAKPAGVALVWLIPESRPSLGQQVINKPGGTIGRNPAAELPLDDPAASWDHARVVERDGSPAVLDLGSSNGTYVNGERVESSMLIAGDRLRIGDTVFRVVKP